MLLVYVSDHGDEFFEHGQWAHGHNLHLGTLNVPLIVRFPGDSPAQRIGQPVQHADLLPTLLEYLGLEVPDTIQGRSLMPLIASPESPALRSPDPIYSHIKLFGPEHTSVRYGDWKLIRLRKKRRYVTHRLYHLPSDPGEANDLAHDHPITRKVLDVVLEKKISDRKGKLRPVEARYDEKVEAELRALGYLE